MLRSTPSRGTGSPGQSGGEPSASKQADPGATAVQALQRAARARPPPPHVRHVPANHARQEPFPGHSLGTADSGGRDLADAALGTRLPGPRRREASPEMPRLPRCQQTPRAGPPATEAVTPCYHGAETALQDNTERSTERAEDHPRPSPNTSNPLTPTPEPSPNTSRTTPKPNLNTSRTH